VRGPARRKEERPSRAGLRLVATLSCALTAAGCERAATPPPESVDSWLRASGDVGYPGAEWLPTECVGKCDSFGEPRVVDTIVVHTTEDIDWDSSVSKLRYDQGKSVHYLVGRDGHIAQFLPEGYVAWHAGNHFVNVHSIGIEHVGTLADPCTEPEYVASAQLVAYLLKKYGISADRAHIIGHYQVPDRALEDAGAPPCDALLVSCATDDRYGGANHHKDPGLLWDWDGYMARIAENTVGPPGTR